MAKKVGDLFLFETTFLTKKLDQFADEPFSVQCTLDNLFLLLNLASEKQSVFWGCKSEIEPSIILTKLQLIPMVSNNQIT